MNTVAKMENVSRYCVQQLVKKHHETGSVADRSRRARPRATTARQDRTLVRMSLRNRRLTAPELKCKWKQESKTNVSVQTVRRRLHEKGFKGCVAVKKPKLTDKHKKKRLAWEKERKTWSTKDWSKILWSDESSFELWRTRGRVYVRRRPHEHYLDECIVSTVKHGGGKVMVWGTMAQSGVGSLTVVEGRLNAEAYIKIARKFVKKDARKLIGRRFTFQQDGAPCHTAKLTTDALQKANICVLPRVAQSPDLNPTEHLWNHLANKLDEMRPTSLQDLKEKIFSAWERIHPDFSKKLVESMLSRVCEVIKGGSTRY